MTDTLAGFYDAFTKPAPPPTHAAPPAAPEGAEAWAAKAYTDELNRLLSTTKGSRNERLNIAAFNLGQIVAAGLLDEITVRQALTDAAHTIGLEPGEIPGTITSGLTSGARHPRHPKASTTAPALTAFHADTDDPEALHAAVLDALPRVDWHALWADDSDEEWIIEPILPARRLVALYSAPKVGKSLLMLEVAAAVAQGHTVLGVTPDRPRRVLAVDRG